MVSKVQCGAGVRAHASAYAMLACVVKLLHFYQRMLVWLE